MGVELSITKNGEFVTELGRAYHFHNIHNDLDVDYDVLEKQVESIEEYLINKINNLVSYMEGREKLLLTLNGIEVNDVDGGRKPYEDRLNEIFSTIKENSEELIGIGKKQLLGYILEDESMGYTIS